MARSKKIRVSTIASNKKYAKPTGLNQNLENHPIFVFDKIDKNGEFAFDLEREDFLHKEFLDKMIRYSQMTWYEISKQTYDKGKSKHHYLSSISKQAEARLLAMELDEYADAIYSFAFSNTLRIIGIRLGNYIHVLWYDKSHRVCPSAR